MAGGRAGEGVDASVSLLLLSVRGPHFLSFCFALVPSFPLSLSPFFLFLTVLAFNLALLPVLFFFIEDKQ